MPFKKDFSITYSKKDFQSNTSIKWCPGCGDYSIYNAVINAFTKLNILRENFLIVSGIGCSSRFPYYCETYGFHTLHGRAPTIAMGAKLANSNLSVWIVTGDGDALSIGGNHFIHILRKNPDINILLFNNEIYGLTKGQYSPTSKIGIKTKTTPMGSVEEPINPMLLALAMGATFIARAIATDTKYMQDVIIKAGEHKGIALVEIMTNCIIFNDNAFHPFEAKSIRFNNIIFLENAKPLIYGKENNMGLILKDLNIEIIKINNTNSQQILRHNTNKESTALQFLLANLNFPQYPLPVGILREISKPVFHDILLTHKNQAIKNQKIKNIEDLVNSGDTWIIN